MIFSDSFPLSIKRLSALVNFSLVANLTGSSLIIVKQVFLESEDSLDRSVTVIPLGNCILFFIIYICSQLFNYLTNIMMQIKQLLFKKTTFILNLMHINQ